MYHILIQQTGGADRLEWREAADPSPGRGQVVVRLAAAGVNFIDTYHRTGLYPIDLPLTPGLEGAGEVVASDSEWSMGDRVAWSGQIGSYAEMVAVDADRLVAVPDAVSLEVAAASMLQGMTAHYLAHDTFPLRGGHRCLVHAGAGGVGLLLIQMAKRAGATVFTTVSTAEKESLARTAGADHVIRYTETSFREAVEEVIGPKELEVVYDGVGADTFEDGLALLRPRGTFVLFGQSSGVVPPFNLGRLAQLGSLFITRPTLFSHIATPAELRRRAGEVLEWVSDGTLDVRIGARFALSEAAEAHRALEGRSTTGKVLLIP